MKLQQYFEAKTELLRLERRIAEVVKERKQAKFDLRDSDERLLTYGGSLRSFLDKLKGKQEERSEALRREVRNAEAKLNTLQREQDSLVSQKAELEAYLQTLPTSEALRAEAEQEWAEKEAAYCTEALLPLLAETDEALLEYRSLLQGNLMRPTTIGEREQITAEPHLRAEKCGPWLQRITEAKHLLGEDFNPGSFLSSPAAYLSGVAARHNQLDRVNQAMNQVNTLRKQIKKQ